MSNNHNDGQGEHMELAEYYNFDEPGTRQIDFVFKHDDVETKQQFRIICKANN